jgi:2-C-methyl-D-erythritol 4-phosphate cytidylyltransferase
MYKYAIIVAGGSGTRMGTEIPKQFLLLNGKPVLWHSIKAFVDAYPDIEIILVLPAQYLQEGQNFKSEFPSNNISIAEGGATRFDSVKNGLSVVREKSIVFVHDAVRCLVSPGLIQQCYKKVIEKGNAIPAIAATDSIRIENGNENKQVDRNSVRIIQTPQTFLSEIILNAFRQNYNPAFTDEASVAESSGEKINLVEGEASNFKITRPIDLLIAEQILKERKAK